MWKSRVFAAFLTALTVPAFPETAVRGDTTDAFFADVMVNSEDEKLRLNRLALLKRLYSLMNRVAELSRLAI